VAFNLDNPFHVCGQHRTGGEVPIPQSLLLPWTSFELTQWRGWISAKGPHRMRFEERVDTTRWLRTLDAETERREKAEAQLAELHKSIKRMGERLDSWMHPLDKADDAEKTSVLVSA